MGAQFCTMYFQTTKQVSWESAEKMVGDGTYVLKPKEPVAPVLAQRPRVLEHLLQRGYLEDDVLLLLQLRIFGRLGY